MRFQVKCIRDALPIKTGELLKRMITCVKSVLSVVFVEGLVVDTVKLGTGKNGKQLPS